MSVTEAQRHHLYESLKTHLGTTEAEIFMNLIPPTDWNDIATKGDVDRLDSRIDSMSGRVDVLSERVDGLVHVMNERFDMVIDHMATKSDLFAQSRTFGTWLFASQAAVIVAVGVFTGILAR